MTEVSTAAFFKETLNNAPVASTQSVILVMFDRLSLILSRRFESGIQSQLRISVSSSEASEQSVSFLDPCGPQQSRVPTPLLKTRYR